MSGTCLSGSCWAPATTRSTAGYGRCAEHAEQEVPVVAMKPALLCGTEGAYRRHLRRLEPRCEPCSAAHRVVSSAECRRALERKHSGAAPPPRAAARCGTTSGGKQHQRLGTPACARCKAAANTYARARNARLRAAALVSA